MSMVPTMALRGLSNSASTRRLCVIGTVAYAMLAITACERPRLPDEAFVALSDPRKAHPIHVVAETATLDLALAPDGSSLASNSYFDAVRFIRRYRQDGKGPLVIAVPGRHSRVVADQVRAIRQVIAQAGVASSNVRYSSAGNHAGRGAITLSYDRIAAIGPKCGDWSENVQRNPENLPYANFGCASQRNLAAMVGTPTDLLYPAQETPRLSERRAAVLKAYIDPPQTTDANIKTR